MKTIIAWTMGLASTLAAATPVTLTTGNDYPPFAHSQLPGGGLATEVVRAALETQGTTLDVRWTTWTRAMKELGRASGGGRHGQHRQDQAQ